MAFKGQTFKIHNIPTMIGGLNDQEEDNKIADNEMADCENVSIEEDSILSAPGYVQWDDNMTGSPASNQNFGPYWGGVMFAKSTGDMLDVRQRQDKLEYSPIGSETWYECTLPTSGSPAVAISLTQIPCTFAHLNDTLLWSNGTDTVMSSADGITWTLRPTLPKSKVVFNNGKNRILFLNQPASPYRFDWCDINQPLTIDASSYQLVDPNSNGYVVGAGLTPDGNVLIFKESSLYSVSGFVDNGIIDISYVGACTIFSHQTIATTENSVIWYGYSSIYEYIGGTIRIISGKISPIGRNAVLAGDLMCGAYYNFKYHLAIPNSDESTSYNCQEYIVYKNIPRNDSIQPYAITRNKRYIGCYFIEDFNFPGYGRDITLYIGDSRSSGNIFAWVNDYRDPAFTKGLNGEAQSCYFVTKFFTDNIPYYVKKFKKLFVNLKLEQTTTFQMAYRFTPYGTFVDEADTLTSGSIDLIYDDLSEGGFSEGYSFYSPVSGEVFADIENVEKPRGIQFKISWEQINDVTITDMAYQYKPKQKFK